MGVDALVRRGARLELASRGGRKVRICPNEGRHGATGVHAGALPQAVKGVSCTWKGDCWKNYLYMLLFV